jgi:hypothetical protein
MSTPTHNNNALLLPDPNDWDMSSIEANIEFYDQEARFFDDLKDDEEDNQQVQPGVGEMVKSAWWDAIKYLGQKLAGIFGGSRLVLANLTILQLL